MENQKPLISVIIPVYNVEAYLEKCLSSVISQSYSEIEIVAVDDGSTDSSAKILSEYELRDGRLKVVTKKNEGLVPARRDGLAAAKGDYIIYIDSDDYINPGYIGSLYEAMESGNHTVAAPVMVRVKREYSSIMPAPGVKEMRGSEFLNKLLRHDIFAAVSGKLYRREVFDDVIFYPDISMWEDFIINIQVALSPSFRSLCFVDSAYYFYLQRPGSMQRSSQKFSYMELFDARVAEILSRNPETALRFRREMIANRAGWLAIYISKKHNEWMGDSRLAKELRAEIDGERKALRSVIRPYNRRMVMLYGRKSNLPVIRMLATLKKWRTSIARRTEGRIKV